MLPFSISRSASALARADAGLVLALGRRRDANRLLAGLGDHPLAVLAGLAHHAVGLRFGVRQEPVGLGAGVVEHRVGLGCRRGHHGVGVRLGVMQHRVTSIEHVLGIIEFAGDRILDVVDQLQHVTSRNHTAGRHGHAAGFFDNGAQFVQRFKDSVHGHTLLASCKIPVVTSVPGVTSVTAVVMPVCRAWLVQGVSKTRLT